MQFYTFRREQWVVAPISKVFSFFSDAHNLEAITPAWLGFSILSSSSSSIAEGTEIDYQIRLRGLPIRWQTEIRIWNPPYRFVDVQRRGPYQMWHHTHIFEASGDRTKIKDTVRYTLPFGPLGRIIHRLQVHGDVQRIFDYRRQRISEIFGEMKDNAE